MWEDSPGRSKSWCKLSQRVTRPLLGVRTFTFVLCCYVRPGLKESPHPFHCGRSLFKISCLVARDHQTDKRSDPGCQIGSRCHPGGGKGAVSWVFMVLLFWCSPQLRA